MVQWLRLHASNAGDTGLIPGQGTKIPHTAPHAKKKKKRSPLESKPVSQWTSRQWNREAVLVTQPQPDMCSATCPTYLFVSTILALRVCLYSSTSSGQEVPAGTSHRLELKAHDSKCSLHSLRPCAPGGRGNPFGAVPAVNGLPGGSLAERPPAHAGDMGLIPGLERSPRRRKWHSTLVFLPGKSHGQRSLVGYSPWGCRVRHD